jgi:pantetheine-phosphate adenylyltransferase
MKKFNNVAVGGTFDELHKGHRSLLAKAFEMSERVFIGVCTDDFVKRLNKGHITASYEDRLAELRAYLSVQGVLDRAKIVPLNDPYGITLSKGCVEALVVSKETEPIALNINEKRKDLGFTPLQIVVIDMVPSENHGSISTTRIRQGEIDREGHLLKRH